MRMGTARTRKPASSTETCPACPTCGCATIKSNQDYTFQVGGDEYRTAPVVKAVVTLNIPVYRCTNKNCTMCLYGEDADEIIEPIQAMLTKNAKPA